MVILNNNYSAYNKLCEIIEENKFTSIIILCDSNTKRLCFDIFKSSLLCFTSKIKIIEITAGEQFKNIETCVFIWEQLLSLSCDRNSLIINLGGGVVSDIGGFVSSTYKRGINYINIPTTLLAMIDASVGSKTGIDLKGIKNIIGSFYSPLMTIIDTRYLTTLPFIEKLNGVAEMLKHGLIANLNHWNDLSLQQIDTITVNQIQESILIKERIVNEDPKEKSIRKILNFGHTIGHAIETFFLNRRKENIGHGIAIAAGIIMETYLSYKYNLINKKELDIIENVIIKLFPKIDFIESDINEISDYTLNDKKNMNQQIKLVMLKDIGTANFDVTVEKEDIIDALMYYSKIKKHEL